jgi:hypothetical protein
MFRETPWKRVNCIQLGNMICYIIYNIIYFVGKVVPINLSSLEEVPGCVGGESKRIWRNNHCWGWTT